MIPQLPDGIGEKEILMFYDTLSGNLSDQATIHMNWHTHRGNPSTCWICDLVTLLSYVLTLALSKYTKSTVDIETDEVQCGTDSDTEIENDNFDEVPNEPEYDVEDGQMDAVSEEKL